MATVPFKNWFALDIAPACTNWLNANPPVTLPSESATAPKSAIHVASPAMRTYNPAPKPAAIGSVAPGTGEGAYTPLDAYAANVRPQSQTMSPNATRLRILSMHPVDCTRSMSAHGPFTSWRFGPPRMPGAISRVRSV